MRVARFLQINLGDVDQFTPAEIDFLCDERRKEIEEERGFFEHLVAWIVCTIINLVSKRKYKISDLLRRREKGESAASQFQKATMELNRNEVQNIRR